MTNKIQVTIFKTIDSGVFFELDIGICLKFLLLRNTSYLNNRAIDPVLSSGESTGFFCL